MQQQHPPGAPLFDPFWNTEEVQALLASLLSVQDHKIKSLQPKQIRELVPINQWLENEYYVGQDGLRLYDFWKEHMSDIFGKNAGKFNELIVTGSIGTGKSTFALMVMMRRLYELSCFINIPSLFKLMSSSFIAFIYFSVSRFQAEITGFGQFRSLLDQSPYFVENFARDFNLNSFLKFPENIIFLAGSDTGHAIGLNLIGSILDEANFFQGETSDVKGGTTVKEYSKVANLYTSIVTRGMSRFIQDQKNHSMSILVSSSTHQSSFSEQRIQAAAKVDTSKVIVTRLWEVKGRKNYSPIMFPVFIGSNLLDPYIVTCAADVNTFLESMSAEKLPDGPPLEAVDKVPVELRHYFVKVPNDFKSLFETNIVQSLQDIAGVSVSPMGRLFSSRQVYAQSIDPSMSHPFYRDSVMVSTGSIEELKDYLRRDYVFKDKERPRYIHTDLSVTGDGAGFAMSYVADHVETKEGYLPVVVNELKVRIDPPKKPQEISIKKVREFIFYLRDVIGLTIGKATYDQYQSRESMQALEANGIPSGLLSVDRDDTAYLNFIQLMFEGRFKTYDYRISERELFDLLHDRARRKVDHPPGGTKDVSDAIVGSVQNALSSVYSEDSIESSPPAVLAGAGFDDSTFTLGELTGGEYDGWDD